MPILLKCHGCGEQLEVDEGFAGGVCRCVHCKALNHVPTQQTELDRKGRPKTPPPMAKPVVMAPEQLKNVRIAETSAFVAAQKRRGLLAIVMLLVAAALGVLMYYLVDEMRGQPTQDEVEREKQQEINREVEQKLSQAGGGEFRDFAGLTFNDGPVAFLLNTANSVGDQLPYAKAVVEQAVARKKDIARRFVVLTWASRSDWALDDEPQIIQPKAFPDQGLGSTDNAQHREGLETWMYDRVASGTGDPAPAVAEALARGATVLVLVTREDISADQLKAVREALAGKSVQLLALSVSDYEAGDLKQLGALVGEGNLAVADQAVIEDWTY
jgi:hypothetical protein